MDQRQLQQSLNQVLFAPILQKIPLLHRVILQLQQSDQYKQRIRDLWTYRNKERRERIKAGQTLVNQLQARMTNPEIAWHVNCSKSLVTYWAQGKRAVTRKYYERLIELLREFDNGA